MKAALLYEANQPLVIEEVDVHLPGPNEVLIRTMAAGVCHSDLHTIEGKFTRPLPVILGHEAAGIVEKVGENVRSVKVGDHVVGCVSAYCGSCEDCLTGHLSLCLQPGNLREPEAEPRLHNAQGTVHQFYGLSAFAELMLVHERNCAVIDRGMPFDRAALLGCAMMTGYGSVAHEARVEPGSTTVVIGCGGVGLATINALQLIGAGRIIAVDRIPEKLAMAKMMGATDLVDASRSDGVEAVLELSKGGVHYSFEAIGLKSTAEAAIKMLRRGGLATIIGVLPPGQTLEIGTMDLLMSRGVRGTMMGGNRFPVDIPRLVDFYLQGRLKLDELISQTLPLERINDAVAELQHGKLARSILTFS